MSGLVHQAARLVNSHRIFFYSLVSIVSVSAVIVNALKNYSNFYSVAIYLSKSSRSVLVLANFGVLLTIICGHVIQRIFFGSLRPNEVERLYDRLWFFITESLLAFTIFRDEFDTPFALMFGFLLFVKSFHWLASDRIEWMDQRPYPGPPLLFHFRMTVLFAILWSTDCLMFLFAIEHTLSAGVGGMVLFASEYGILIASIMNTILKYLLSAYDLRRAGRRGGENAPPWENKSMWTFYIELLTDFLKLTTYLVFFIIIITFYGLPLNIIRDVYITARSFVTRLKALHRYQTATRNMDQRYPNATDGELSAMSDRTCIICREELVNGGTQDNQNQADGPNTTPKKLPCGHIFHFHCLRSWLERQQSCPTCRRNVLEISPEAQPTPGQAPGQIPLQEVPNQRPRDDPPIAQPQAGNNPLGLIGRYMGLPPGPVNQLPHRQAVQNGNNNQLGQQNGQGGIYINYQVQYQFPRPNDRGAQNDTSQQQPIPPYPGFDGPQGTWQPWTTRDNTPVVEPSNGAQPDTDGGESQHSSSPSLESISTMSSSSSSTASQERSDISPREAAALAALNRLSVKPGSKSNELKPASSNNTSASSSTSPSIERSSNSTAIPTPTSTNTTTSVNSSYPPRLIPLIDFSAQPSAPHTSFPAQPRNSTSNNISTRRTLLRNNINLTSSLPASSQTQESLSSATLPVNLTDEQLANLDRLTRESIDERLRILEGVSASVYRCIDDLMRLRSVLPPLNLSPAPSGSQAQAPISSRSQQVPQSDAEVAPQEPSRGKEKMREATTEEPESSNQGSSAFD